MFGPCQIDSKEGTESEDHRYSDISRKVGSSREERNNPYEIVEKDEEEGRTEIGRISSVILSDILLSHIVDHHHKGFHKGGNPCRRLTQDVMALIPPGTEKENDEYQEG